MTIFDDRETLSGPMDEIAEPDPPQSTVAPRPTLAAGHTPSLCVAPDLVGLDALDAQGVARKAGVRLSISAWETKVGPWGMILVQHPSPGARVRPGSRVHVVQSRRPHARVPDVRGLPAEEAVELVRRMGLLAIVADDRASPSTPKGHVVSIRPIAGTLVVDGSTVVIDIAPAGRTTQDASAGVDLPTPP